MSNPSLKEQLQALSLAAAPAPASDNRAKHKKGIKPGAKPAKQKPAWLEHAQYGVELLKAYFPHCFREPKEVKPLKIGIKQDLVKNLSSREDIVINDKACMVNSLAYYVNSISYHKCVTVGATRFDLDGQPAGTVTAEEANYSAECCKTKLLKKQPNQHQLKAEAVK